MLFKLHEPEPPAEAEAEAVCSSKWVLLKNF